MKFELNEWHHNVSDEEFLQDLHDVATRLSKTTITHIEYNQHGRYYSNTISKRFGGWNVALKKAGLSSSHNHYVTNECMISDIQEVANSIGCNTLSRTQYDQLGKFHSSTITRRFGSWEDALSFAGLQHTGFVHRTSNDELIKDIENTWIILGRQPTTSDIKKGHSQFGLTTYIRHFGSWRKALEAFILYINNEHDSMDDSITQPDENTIIEEQVLRHKTPRDINLRLRFLVMKRDSFRCKICGSSPAKDPSVELHIDHIIPWAKGGETVIDNLQTLCSKCNLGKSDLDM